MQMSLCWTSQFKLLGVLPEKLPHTHFNVEVDMIKSAFTRTVINKMRVKVFF